MAKPVERFDMTETIRRDSRLRDSDWAKIELRPSGCWQWMGATGDYGYGRVSQLKKTWLSHRYTWTRLRGPIPDGLELDHLCRNPGCVNPDHLEPVTHLENMRRAERVVRTTCAEGHEFDAIMRKGNRPDGRRCRKCDARRARSKYAAKKAREAAAQ